MPKTRGFQVGRRLVRAFKRFIHRRRRLARYRLCDRSVSNSNPISKIVSLARDLRRGARRLCSRRWERSGYELVDQAKPVAVPKGHLAVYVGESDDDAHRILVPVIYFNHPLFGELLKEAERVYGFDHPGGITIPCGVSEFEKVKTTIAAAGDGLRRREKGRSRHR